MPDTRQGSPSANEFILKVGVAREMAVEGLQRDVAGEQGVEGSVNCRESALPSVQQPPAPSLAGSSSQAAERPDGS